MWKVGVAEEFFCEGCLAWFGNCGLRSQKGSAGDNKHMSLPLKARYKCGATQNTGSRPFGFKSNAQAFNLCGVTTWNGINLGLWDLQYEFITGLDCVNDFHALVDKRMLPVICLHLAVNLNFTGFVHTVSVLSWSKHRLL